MSFFADRYTGRTVQLSLDNVVDLVHQGVTKRGVVAKDDRPKVKSVDEDFSCVNFIDDDGKSVCDGKLNTSQLKNAKVIDQGQKQIEFCFDCTAYKFTVVYIT